MTCMPMSLCRPPATRCVPGWVTSGCGGDEVYAVFEDSGV